VVLPNATSVPAASTIPVNMDTIEQVHLEPERLNQRLLIRRPHMVMTLLYHRHNMNRYHQKMRLRYLQRDRKETMTRNQH
jgi:hypothetical protein